MFISYSAMSQASTYYIDSFYTLIDN